jgi:hypothetical protein
MAQLFILLFFIVVSLFTATEQNKSVTGARNPTNSGACPALARIMRHGGGCPRCRGWAAMPRPHPPRCGWGRVPALSENRALAACAAGGLARARVGAAGPRCQGAAPARKGTRPRSHGRATAPALPEAAPARSGCCPRHGHAPAPPPWPACRGPRPGVEAAARAVNACRAASGGARSAGGWPERPPRPGPLHPRRRGPRPRAQGR